VLTKEVSIRVHADMPDQIVLTKEVSIRVHADMPDVRALAEQLDLVAGHATTES